MTMRKFKSFYVKKLSNSVTRDEIIHFSLFIFFFFYSGVGQISVWRTVMWVILTWSAPLDFFYFLPLRLANVFARFLFLSLIKWIKCHVVILNSRPSLMLSSLYFSFFLFFFHVFFFFCQQGLLLFHFILEYFFSFS